MKLRDVPRESGAGAGRPPGIPSRRETGFPTPTPTPYQKVLEEAHLPRPTAAKFEQLAKLSDEKFEQHITESAADKLTMNAALKKAARERQPGPVAERGFDGWAEMLAYRPDPDEEPDAGWDPLRDEW